MDKKSLLFDLIKSDSTVSHGVSSHETGLSERTASQIANAA